MKRLFQIGTVVAGLAVIATVSFIRSRQTQFGQIKRTGMAEPHNPTRIEQLMSQAGELLHLPIAHTRHRRSYLKFGDWEMQWSLMSTTEKKGWLLFFKPFSNDEVWEFAPCSRASLHDLVAEDLKTEFLRYGNPQIESIFGTDLRLKAVGAMNGRGILVREGQIVLARPLHAPHLIYAIKLIDQKGTWDRGSIRIEYVRIDSHRAEPTGSASRSQPVRLGTNQTSAGAGSGR